jgi:two-component system chemotaxis sensor kinase CheA
LVFDVDAPNLLNNTASKKSQEEAERHLMFTCATGEHCGLITGLIDFTHVTTKDQLMSMNGRYFVRIHERDYQLIDLSEYTELQSIDIDSLDDIFLIIPKHIKSNLAFLASSIRGIEDIPTNLPYVVENKAGTLGTVIWNEELTTLIDLFNLESLITGKKEPTLRLDRRVLLLEDTPMFQKIVKDHLENMGFHVSLAGDGLEGLAHLQKQTFDVIVSDIEMPNMNGYEFCATVREDPQWEHLPIIAMTSLKSDEAKTRASAVGFTEYLVKINRNDFTKTLQRVLGDQNIG